MEHEQALLDAISEAADMGRDSLSQVMEQAQGDGLRDALRSQYVESDRLYREVEGFLHGANHEPKKSNPLAKTFAHVSGSAKTMMSDRPDSTIAEMVIQGSTMGITKLEQAKHAYHGDNHAMLELANKMIRTELANIEQMKAFL